MGVKMLNSFLKRNNLIQRNVGLKCLNGKKIVIDTNNYIYEFMSTDNLMNGFISMCELFLKYNIIPLFIFDGKPTKEKMGELEKRKKEREESKKIYNENNLTKKKRKELMRKIVRVTKKETDIVKFILEYYNIKFIDSPSESDELCCKLVEVKKTCGCLSNDMDMLVYGCNYVFRNLDLRKESVDVYDMGKILQVLYMSLDSFKYWCLYSNKHDNIFKNYEYYKDYHMLNTKDTFLEYLQKNESISKEEFINIENNYKFYNLKNSIVLNNCPYILLNYPKRIFSTNYIRKKLRQMLKPGVQQNHQPSYYHSSQNGGTYTFGD